MYKRQLLDRPRAFGHGSDLHALVVLVELRLREIKRLRLHHDVLLRVNEFVVGILDGGDGCDELQAQSLFGKFQAVFVHQNRQPRAVNPEIFQQWLREVDADRAGRAFGVRRASGVGDVAVEVILQAGRQQPVEMCIRDRLLSSLFQNLCLAYFLCFFGRYAAVP